MGIFLTLLIVLVPINVIFALSPLLSKKSIQFGVAIPEPYLSEPELKNARRSYIRLSVLVGAADLVCFTAFLPWRSETLLAAAMITATIGALLGHSLLYLYYYKKLRKLKLDKGWEEVHPSGGKVVVDTSFHASKKTYSNAWFLIHIAIAAATAVYLYTIYDSIPDRFATHYDFQGKADAFSNKSWLTVFEIPMIQLAMIAVFWLVNWLTAVTKQQADPKAPKKSLANSIKFRKLTSLFLIALSLPIIGFLSAIIIASVTEGGDAIIPVITMTFLVLLVVGIAAIITMSIRVKKEVYQEETTITPIDRDEYWKLGSIYYNKSDPALFVEKRHGIGFTVNAARPLGMALMTLPLIIIIIVVVIVSFYS
ncbi:DUF1648 domain-containing protein [Paenibacillus sp. NPDC058071]|uniref:DUF1648 domain-containing protein n=1 Tax=Paenibacillus sp. NPDC058071 TaxID=3346326 RepID=UPI0036DCED6C